MPGGFPYLAHQQAIGLERLHAAAEFAPEAIVNLAGHIQPPAVDIKGAHPMLPDAAEIVAHLRIGGIELGHGAFIAEALVIGDWFAAFRAHDGQLQMVKPIAVRRGSAAARHILKGKKAPRTVVEHAVEHYAQVAGMAFFHQRAQVVVRAQRRVDVEIVERIILVISPGRKNRV